jgi:hypothetical protein
LLGAFQSFFTVGSIDFLFISVLKYKTTEKHGLSFCYSTRRVSVTFVAFWEFMTWNLLSFNKKIVACQATGQKHAEYDSL